MTGPPNLPGIRWFRFICPGCGDTWWNGVEIEQDDALAVAEAAAAALGVCADCRYEAWSGDATHPAHRALRKSKRRAVRAARRRERKKR